MEVQLNNWVLTGHMLASAVLLGWSRTSWIGARLGPSSEILLVYRLFCPPRLSETGCLTPLGACHACMPVHIVYDTGLVPTTVARHDWLGFPFPVDLT